MPSRKLPAPLVGHTVATVAAALGIAPRTMRRACSDGRVKTVPIKLAKLIPVEEAERVLAQPRRYWPGARTHGPDGQFKEAPP